MSPFDAFLIAAFVAYAITSGFRARWAASQGAEAYFLAGRTIRGWQAGLSMAATQYAADTPLVVTGLVATAGVFALWRFWVYSLAFLLMGFLLAAPWRRAGIITDAELCERRYSGASGEALRYLKAIYFGTVINCVVLAMVLLAATRITEPFLPWHLWLPEGFLQPLAGALQNLDTPLTADLVAPELWLRSAANLFSILCIVAFTALYSTTGGLRSVVRTDVVQVTVALAATAVYAWVVTDRIGGLAAIPAQLQTLYGTEAMHRLLSFSPIEGAGEAALTVLGVLGIQWVAQANADGTGYLAQRSMACRSDRDARIAGVVFTYVQSIVRTLLWLPIVVGLLVLYPATDPISGDAAIAAREATFIRGIVDHLPPGALGLMLVGLLAALASTVDTHLNWGASYYTNDLYKRLWCQRLRRREPKERTLVWVARGSNLIILLIALLIMFRLGSVQSAWKTSLLFGAGIGVPLILRWLWHRQNAWGELVPIAVSLLAAPLLLHLLPAEQQESWRMLLMALVATTSSVLASLLSAPVDRERLQAFYHQVKPPGFWRPVALACGDDAAQSRRELRRGGLATASAAMSVFSLIVGFGSWILHAPAPSWLPWRGAWIALCLALGFGLIRGWWRRLR